MAPSTSSLSSSFRTYPLAPARMAVKTVASSSNMVTTRTRICGFAASTRRVASIPPRPGLFARCCLACHLDVRLSCEEAPHLVAEEGMVVGDQDAQLLQSPTPPFVLRAAAP